MHPNEPPSVTVSRCELRDAASDPSRTVVWISGDHDIGTRTHLSDVFAQAVRLDDVDIIVDLSGATFMDASTIDAIVDAHNRLCAHSRALTVRAPSDLARRLLDVCELAFLVDEHPTPAHPTGATALKSWVAVPGSGRASGSTQPPVDERAARPQTARAGATGREEPAASVQQRRAPS